MRYYMVTYEFEAMMVKTNKRTGKSKSYSIDCIMTTDIKAVDKEQAQEIAEPKIIERLHLLRNEPINKQVRDINHLSKYVCHLTTPNLKKYRVIFHYGKYKQIGIRELSARETLAKFPLQDILTDYAEPQASREDLKKVLEKVLTND